MYLVELIDDRKDVFSRPKTQKDLLRNRNTISATSFFDIVSVIEQRESNQAVLLQGFDIIPDGYYSAQNFSKRGNLVHLNTFQGNQTRLKQDGWTPLMARIEASEKYKRENGPFVGWEWSDPEGYHHVVHPSTVVEGHRLYQYGLKAGTINDRTLIKDYHAADMPRRDVRVLVPSRSEDSNHEVILEHLTKPNDLEQFVEWTRFSTRHECPIKRNDFSFRFKNSVTYCPHDVAAHVAYSKKVGKESGRIVPQPFPLFSEPLLRLYMALSYDTLKLDVSSESGKVRTKTRPLSFAEIDTILMDAWLSYGNKMTFYARSPTKAYHTKPPKGGWKRMPDYDWSVAGSNLPFVN